MFLPSHNKSPLFDLYEKHSLSWKEVCLVFVDVFTGWTNVNLLYLLDSIEIASSEGLCPEINQSKRPLAWSCTIFIAWRQWPSTASQTLLRIIVKIRFLLCRCLLYHYIHSFHRFCVDRSKKIQRKLCILRYNRICTDRALASLWQTSWPA